MITKSNYNNYIISTHFLSYLNNYVSAQSDIGFIALKSDKMYRTIFLVADFFLSRLILKIKILNEFNQYLEANREKQTYRKIQSFLIIKKCLHDRNEMRSFFQHWIWIQHSFRLDGSVSVILLNPTLKILQEYFKKNFNEIYKYKPQLLLRIFFLKLDPDFFFSRTVVESGSVYFSRVDSEFVEK